MNDALLVVSMFASVFSQLVDKKVTRTASAWDSMTFGILFQMVLLMPFFVNFDIPSLPVILLLIGVGVLTGFARFLWYVALKGDLLIRVAPFRRLSIVFTFLFALFVLGERKDLSAHEFIGAGIMLVGALVMTLTSFTTKLRDFLHANRYVACVLFFALSLAVWKGTARYLLDPENGYGISVFTAYILMKGGQLLVAAPRLVRPKRVDKIWGIAVSQTLQTLGSLLFLFVLSRQALTLSEPITAASPFILIILSRFLLGEKDKAWGLRVGAVAIMAVGYLVMRGVTL